MCISWTIKCLILLMHGTTMKFVSQYIFREHQNTLYVQLRVSEKHANYEIMWKYMVETNSPQMTMRCMRFACWITGVTGAHSESTILIAFSRQQWLR